MNLPDELGVEEGQRCIRLLLTGFDHTEGTVVVLDFRILCLELAIDLESIL